MRSEKTKKLKRIGEIVREIKLTEIKKETPIILERSGFAKRITNNQGKGFNFLSFYSFN